MRSKNSEAVAKKNTFWNELRVKNNYTYKDLADTLNASIGNVGNWFSGRIVPTEKRTRDICDLFGVDYDTGRAEFIKANKSWKSDWKSDRGTVLYVPELPKTSLEDDPQEGPNTPTTEPTPTDFPKAITFDFTDPEAAKVSEGATRDTANTILKYFYDKLDFDDFVKLQESLGGHGDPLKVIFQKVDFDDFMAISAQLSQG